MDDVKVSVVTVHQGTNSNRLSKKSNQALQGQSGIIDHIHLYSSTLYFCLFTHRLHLFLLMFVVKLMVPVLIG